MVRIYLELAVHDFDRIGALSEAKDDNGASIWSVSSRPMTLKMDEIERAGYVVMNGKILIVFLLLLLYLFSYRLLTPTVRFGQRIHGVPRATEYHASR